MSSVSFAKKIYVIKRGECMDRLALRNQIDTIKDIVNAIQKNITINAYNIESAVKRLVDAMNEMTIMTDELLCTVEDSSLIRSARQIRATLKLVSASIPQLLDTNAKNEAIRIISDYISDLEAPYIYSNRNRFMNNLLDCHSDIMLANSSNQTIARTMIDMHIQMLQELLQNDEPVNFFMPHYVCFQNHFLNDMLPKLTEKISRDNLHVYVASEYADSINYSDRDNFDGVAVGNFDNFMATNNAFDLIYDIPPVSWYSQDSIPPCVFLLKRYWNYLKINGVLVLNIASYFMTRELRSYIYKHFKIIGLKTCEVDTGLPPTRFYALALQKTLPGILGNDMEEFQYKLLTDLALKNINDLDFQQTTPALPVLQPVQVKIFKGPEPDTALIMSVLANSPLYQEKPKAEAKQLQPLLPFERGQIGLVLASGKLDGVIDEGNGFKHVIRGRVYKDTVRKRNILEEHPDSRDGVMEVIDTTNNMTEINVMTGNGIYKQIVVPVAV